LGGVPFWATRTKDQSSTSANWADDSLIGRPEGGIRLSRRASGIGVTYVLTTPHTPASGVWHPIPSILSNQALTTNPLEPQKSKTKS